MGKKTKKKNNLKEDIIMENNNTEELNQNIEEVTEVTETVEKVIESAEEVSETVEENIETIEEENKTVEEVTETTAPEVIEPNTDESVENNEVIGKLFGYEKLYIRKEASKESEPEGIVTNKDSLFIDLENSTEEFYKVRTSTGLDGYCMKKFVKMD